MSHTPLPPPSRRSYGGIAPEDRAARRRQQFIEAGKALFGTVGYRKTTMRALCKEAGLTDRYFYESFDTLEDLLVAAYEDLIGQLQAALAASLQGAGERGLEAVIEGTVDAYFRQVENPVLGRIVWLEVLGVSPRVDALYNRTTRDFARYLLSLARTLLPGRQVDDAIAEVVAIGAVGALSETAKDWLMTGYARPRRELVQGSSLLLRGVLRAFA